MRARILVISKFAWPEGGGAELATWLYLMELSKYFDVTLVTGTARPSGDLLGRVRHVFLPGLARGNFKVNDWLTLYRNRDFRGRLVRKHDLVYIPSRNVYPMALIAKSVDANKPVIIHVHDYQPITYTAAKFPGIGSGFRTDITYERLEHGLLKALLVGYLSGTNLVNREAVRHSDLVVFVSRRQAEYVMNVMPDLKGRGVVIYNPPPPVGNGGKKFSEEPTGMFMGGLSKVKGFLSVIGALRRLALSGVRVRVLVSNYVDLGKVLNYLNGLIQFIGRVGHDELLSRLRTTWFTLHPSIYEEPLPYSLIEALLTNNAVIASRVGGIPEILTGTPMERFLVNPWDIDGVVDRINKAMDLGPGGIYEVSRKSAIEVERRLTTSSSILIRIVGDMVNMHG